MTQNASSQNSICFPPFELDPGTGELRKHGTRLKLSGQAIRVLTMLAAVPGEMVSREALKQALWPGATSGDFEHGLNAAVNRLREVLGDSAKDPIYIETLPGKGYRFIGALTGSQPGASSDGPPLQPTTRRAAKLGMVLALAAVVFIGVLYLVWAPLDRTWRLYQRERLTVVRLTSLPGSVYSPSFSPDGSQVAFAWNGDAESAGYDLYVKAFGSSEAPHRLTRHPAMRLSVAWSPDGESIAFSRVAGANSGVFLIGATGGVERKIAARSERTWYGAELSWSPDGKQIAFIDRPTSSKSDQALQLYLLSLDTLEKKEVDTGCLSVALPSFSRNGEYLAWVCNREMFKSEINLQRLRDGKILWNSQAKSQILGLAWSSDDRHMMFSTVEDSGALRELEIASPNRVETISLGQDASDLAIRSINKGIAYVKNSYNVNIWRLNLSKSPAQARPLIVSSQTDKAPSISPDARKIAFESTRTGNSEVWIADANGTNAQQVSFFKVDGTGTPKWAPDSKRLVFDSRVGDEANIYVADLDGGRPRKLEIDVHGNGQPVWSHDGQWIYFSNGDDRGTPSVWKVPASGGHAIRLSGVGGSFPLESADGSVVYFTRAGRLWSVREDGSQEQMVEAIPQLTFLGDEYFPAANGIYFMSHNDRASSIELFDYKTRRIRTVYTTERSTPPWIGGMPVSDDGRWMLYPQEDHSSSDLMMLENWR